jgi:hypothetical protein
MVRAMAGVVSAVGRIVYGYITLDLHLLEGAIVHRPADVRGFQPSKNNVQKSVDNHSGVGYIHKAVEASSAKAPLEATSEPRQLYIVLRDRIAFKIRECNSKRVGILNNRDDESD